MGEVVAARWLDNKVMSCWYCLELRFCIKSSIRDCTLGLDGIVSEECMEALWILLVLTKLVVTLACAHGRG